jgi:hypothetical protein
MNENDLSRNSLRHFFARLPVILRQPTGIQFRSSYGAISSMRQHDLSIGSLSTRAWLSLSSVSSVNDSQLRDLAVSSECFQNTLRTIKLSDMYARSGTKADPQPRTREPDRFGNGNAPQTRTPPSRLTSSQVLQQLLQLQRRFRRLQSRTLSQRFDLFRRWSWVVHHSS